MVDVIPWALSCWTLTTMWLAGNKNKYAWVSGLLSQGLWLTFSVLIEAWGLIPLALALIFVYSRNLRRWSRETV